MEGYKKDFDQWNVVKKGLEQEDRVVFFNTKEVWWCSVGVNVGSEHDGKGWRSMRPVYILKKINSKTFIGIPLTTQLKEDGAHMSFYFNYDISTAVFSQIKVFDKKRLFYKRIGVVSDYLHEKMKKAVVAYLVS